MDPSDAKRPRVRTDIARDAVDDLIRTGAGGGVIERHTTNSASRALRSVMNRLVRREVIVLRREDLLIRTNAQPVICHRQAARRVLRVGDLVRHAADVIRDRLLHGSEWLAFGVSESGDLYPRRIRIEL